MNRKLAASVLSVLLYAQGLLGFAGLATVLLKNRAEAADMSGRAIPVAHSVLG